MKIEDERLQEEEFYGNEYSFQIWMSGKLLWSTLLREEPRVCAVSRKSNTVIYLKDMADEDAPYIHLVIRKPDDSIRHVRVMDWTQ